MTLDIQTDWSTDGVVNRREQFYAASQRKFQPYRTPLIFKRGSGQYLWDELDNRLIDLLAMNLCISVGYAHPEINRATREQADMLQHCTTMFYHPVPAHYCEELAATMPKDYEWVVHLTNSGSEAVDLARINHQFENWAPYCLEISLQYCLWPVQSMIRHFSAQLKHKVSNLVVVEEILALVRHDRADFDALTTPGASTKTGHWMC